VSLPLRLPLGRVVGVSYMWRTDPRVQNPIESSSHISPVVSVKRLVADGSITAGAATTRLLMVSVNGLELAGFAHFIHDQ
jgi:hypothetical protein